MQTFTYPTPPVPLTNLFPASLPAPNIDPPPASAPRVDPTQTWTVYLAPNPTPATRLTAHKTTFRDPYDAVRKYIPTAEGKSMIEEEMKGSTEILLVNEEGNVMEGSITTPYFWRGGRWVTPREADGGNKGTTRRWALEMGLVIEEVVPADGEAGVKDGEVLWLSNGVRGWGCGRVMRGVGETRK